MIPAEIDLSAQGELPILQASAAMPPFPFYLSTPLLWSEEESFPLKRTVIDTLSNAIGTYTPPPLFLMEEIHTPEIQAVAPIIETIVGGIVHMRNAGITETLITLDHPQFSSSPFFGLTIVIREFNTAPKSLHIQLVAAPQVMELLAIHLPAILGALNKYREYFKVEHMDVGLKIRDEWNSDDLKVEKVASSDETSTT